MGEVVWTEPALTDLRRIVDLVAKDAPAAATKLAAKVVRAPRRLSRTPRCGAIVPEFEQDSIRELLVRPYRIIYVVQDETCSIVAVIHGRRDLTNLSRFEDFGPT